VRASRFEAFRHALARRPGWRAHHLDGDFAVEGDVVGEVEPWPWPPRPRRPSTSYSPIVAVRRGVDDAGIARFAGRASSLAVAKAVCWPEISEPQLGQKRGAGLHRLAAVGAVWWFGWSQRALIYPSVSGYAAAQEAQAGVMTVGARDPGGLARCSVLSEDQSIRWRARCARVLRFCCWRRLPPHPATLRSRKPRSRSQNASSQRCETGDWQGMASPDASECAE